MNPLFVKRVLVNFRFALKATEVLRCRNRRDVPKGDMRPVSRRVKATTI